jgi:ABC-2 type transport system ATP-binding protein
MAVVLPSTDADRRATPASRAATRPSSAALGFEGVSKRFRKGTLALDNVTLSVPVGARACLLGPNGAGKSTAIRLLEGALVPTAGRVSLLGADVGGHAYLAARQRTGIVPQGPGMYTDLTVAEYLDLALRLYGRGDVARLEALLDLGPHRRTMLSQLSGGYQRRVVLAAALLAGPEVLLLDEPTVGLDPVAAHDVHAFLREEMRRDGRTTLLCTHNLAEAEALCEEVIILRAGRVRVQATLADLRGRAQPQLRLAARQGAAALLAALGARGFQGRVQDNGSVELRVPDPEAIAPAVLRALLAEGLDIYACEPVQPSLEDLFLDLVRDEGGAR